MAAGNQTSPPTSGGAPTRRRHLEMLFLVTAIVVLAPTLQVQADQRVALFFLPDFPLPETCLSKTLWGIPCPGCGLTRSFIYLAHGDWRASGRCITWAGYWPWQSFSSFPIACWPWRMVMSRVRQRGFSVGLAIS